MDNAVWPVTDGRYGVGNKESPVAVCTMATVELDLPMDKIAIKGKCVTENIGVEKIVQNIVTNPNIRYLIFCGKDSRGHFIRQAIENLIEKGVEGPNKRIIGALGAMAEVKNLTTNEVETFRKQVTTVSLADVTDIQEIMKVVEEYYSKNPGPYQGNGSAPEAVQESPAPTGPENVDAPHHPLTDWTQDPKGFFIIRPDRHRNVIFAEHFDNEKRLLRLITGKTAEDMYHTIIKMGLITRQDHAAYVGRELAKAETALINKLEYEQDSVLKVPEPKPVPPAPQPVAQPPKEKEFVVDDGKSAISRTFLLAGKVTYTVTERVKEDPEFDSVRKRVGLHRAF